MHGFRLARVAAIPIEIRYSFIFLLIFAFYGGILHGMGAHAFLVLVVGFASIFLHELGHAFVARWRHIPVLGISLHALGGETRLATLPHRPLDEFLIGAAGPFVSLLLAGLSGLWLWTTGAFWAELCMVVNLLIAGGNLLPALPLDGGRILCAVLVPHWGEEEAMRRMVLFSRAVALVVGACAPLLEIWVLLPLGFMLFFGAAAHERAAKTWAKGRGADGAQVDVLDLEGRPAGSRSTTLGGTYIIEKHRNAFGTSWVVRDLGGRVLLVTDVPLGEEANTPRERGEWPLPEEDEEGPSNGLLGIC
ncbi:MAG: hypothetical protein JRH20_18675 [Deltaproteobacteria bacterium]|nr:hypothetical protein [Deltaproteobacteria bacterium]